MTATVSVIVTIFNGERWIDGCFESIARQDVCSSLAGPLAAVEVCVFDDASTDRTAELLLKWADKFQKCGIGTKISKNSTGNRKGVSYGRNQAVKSFEGNYLCFQDVDDEMLPERISSQLLLAQQNQDAIIGSRFVRAPENSTCRFSRWANEINEDQLEIQIFTSNGPTVIMPTWFCSKEVFKRLKSRRAAEVLRNRDVNLKIFIISLRLKKSSGVDQETEKMQIQTEIGPEENLTTLQKFYHGTNILITGGTGFLGKMLLNKLFTSCPGIENIFLLIRNKKGKDVHSRVEEIFDDPIFNTMKQTVPKFRHRVQGIPGDCMLSGLGLSSSDRQMLIRRVNIVFHMAATVRFDEKLKIAMQINVQACKDIMQICSEMSHLKSAVHVSTAYTQCPLRKIEEKFYPPPIDSGNMLLLTECAPEKLLESITPILLDKWPNTYTFTKAIAEDVIHQHGKSMPVGMFRPGIVISTYRDPVCGWIDNFYGPTGAIAGAGTGVIRTLRCDPNAVANMVPVDLCVNSIIAAGWDISQRYSTINVNHEIPVYNFCTAKDNQLTWGDFTTKTTKYGLMYPTIKAMWYLCYANNPNKFVHLLSILFLHYVPAIILDAFSICIRKKPRLLNTYKKIHRFMHVIEYFSMRQWEYQMDNVRNLWQKLSDRDREIFFFDMSQLDWDLFLQHYFRGIRQYLLNDPLETIPEALVRWNRLYWLHQSIKLFVVALLLKVLWSILSLFFNFTN